MALQQNDQQEKHIFVCGTFEDFPLWDKICTIMTNHRHLKSVGDNRKFVLKNSYFASADRPLVKILS